MTDPHWSQYAAFWVSVLAVIAAAISAMVTYQIFKSNVDPSVIVYVAADERVSDVLTLVIENIGKGVAKNITFTISQPLPWQAFKSNLADKQAPIMDSGPLISGISALPPGGRRVIYWGGYSELLDAVGDREITVTAIFRSDPVGHFVPTWFEVASPVEIGSFSGTAAAGANPDREAAKQLKRIADVLGFASSGFRPLKIEPRERKRQRPPPSSD